MSSNFVLPDSGKWRRLGDQQPDLRASESQSEGFFFHSNVSHLCIYSWPIKLMVIIA